jgi:hypothetical protein
MWDPRPLTTLWALTACYRDSLTFFLWDPNVYYHVHKIPPRDPVLIPHSFSHQVPLRAILILFTCPYRYLLSCLFHSGFRGRSCMYLIYPMRATWIYPNNIWWRVQTLKLLLCLIWQSQSTDYKSTISLNIAHVSGRSASTSAEHTASVFRVEE